MASLSKEKALEPVPQWAFIGLNLYRTTLPSVIVSGLSQAGEVGQPRD